MPHFVKFAGNPQDPSPPAIKRRDQLISVGTSIREPRVQYVSPLDRLMVGVSLFAPGLADWLLARSFHWEST
mgnify:CR=1 FL=1